MTTDRSIPRSIFVWVAVIAVMVVVAVGCSSEDATSSTTTASISSTTTTVSTSIDTTTPTFMSEWDKQIRMVAGVQNELAGLLIDEDVSSNDPRMGVLYGLRACTQAIACRQALDGANLELADAAMQELRYTLNLARNVAAGSTAETIAAARAIIEPLGKPSSSPQEAATILEEFIAALVPLTDEAAALLEATTTT